MKLTPFVLGISLAANVAGMVVLVRQASPGKPIAEANRAAANAPEEHRAAGRAAAQDASGPTDEWRAIAQGSLPDMVARLRAAGFPASAIRALVWARVREQHAARRRALMAEVEEEPYWRAGMSRGISAKMLAARQELHEEETRVMRELLGDDASEDDEISQYFRRRQFGNMSAEKASRVQRVTADYMELRNEIQRAGAGLLLPEDREQIAYLEREMRKDLAEMLTPEELEGYELRSSSAAHLLRSRLTTFQPTEDEFRALFRVSQRVDEQLGPITGIVTGDEMKQRTAALNEEARRVLAPDRYAEFAQATDPQNRVLNGIAARYGLPTTVVPEVHAVRQDIQQRAAAARVLPPAERTAALNALATEATTRLAPLLGERGLEAYRTYDGHWMRTLVPPSSSPASVPGAVVVPKG